MNRKFIISHKWAAACILIAGLIGCSKTSIAPSSDPFDPSSGAPIEFSAQDAFTKAVVTDESDIENDPAGILVWDWHTSLAYPNGTHTFDAEQVTYSSELGAWTYSPTRYWLNGTYDFAAVYPSTVAATYAPAQLGEDPILTVEDFDVTNQDDLLVAFKTGVDGVGRTAEDAVNLNFQHALSGVQIELRLKPEDFYEIEKDEDGNFLYDENDQPIYSMTENGEKIQIGTAYVTKISFNNVSIVGSLSTVNEEIVFSDWTASEAISNIEFNYTNAPIVITDVSTPCIKDGGLLIIPQNVAEGDGEMNMELVVEFPSIVKEPIKRIVNIPLKAGAAKAPKWEPNTKYIYSAIIDQNFAIDFGLADVEVVGWKYGTLGGITVN